MTPVVMTIAGSDPSGSSGLQADLPTLAAFDVHATSVVTTLTAQDTMGVRAFHEVPVELVESQLHHLVADLAPAATKTGLLRTEEIVDLVTAFAESGLLGRLVVDPVLVDSSGAPIVSEATVEGYRRLAQRAVVLTPNRWEAELLTGASFDDDPTPAVVRALRSFGCEAVVVTGGRGDGRDVIDVVITGESVRTVSAPRVGTTPIRGTGCTFSAATAAGLGTGLSALEAVDRARTFVAAQLARGDALRLGAGRPGVPHGIARSAANK